MVKEKLKKILPFRLIRMIRVFESRLSLLSQYIYDYRIYCYHNGRKSKMGPGQLEGKIIAHYHVLEKGISHPVPKKCFSLPVVENLVGLINEYDLLCPVRSRQVNVAVSVLKNYCLLPSNKNFIPIHLVNKIDALKSCDGINSGALWFEKSEFFKESNASFIDFSMSRYSVRDFTEESVDVDLLKKAVRVAQKTPSVCNRQTSRVYILTDKADIERHLLLQTGNRGFGHKINKLLIVASNLNFFEGPKERNQAFVDGGMFAMSLLYALHNLQIGAITLNWAYDKNQDCAAHELGVVPSNEKIILFIGVGHVPERFKVAASNRREENEVVVVI